MNQIPISKSRGSGLRGFAPSVPLLPALLILLGTVGTLGALGPLCTPAFGQDPSLIDEAGFPRAAAIQGNRVNIRTGPSTNHIAITQLPDRTPVIATGRKGDWVRFALPPAVKVWVSQRYVESATGDQIRVTGNRVRLRARPTTMHVAVGEVVLGTLLEQTGKIDSVDRENGPWVEVEAPLQSTGWIHGRYLQLGDRLDRSAMATFYRRPARPVVKPPVVPVVDRTGGAPRIATPPQKDPLVDPNEPKIEFHFPVAGREPLVALYNKLRTEHAKPPTQWKFEPIIVELRELANTSEDLVVADKAREWIGIVEKYWVPRQHRMVALEREKEAARRASQEAIDKETENELRPGTGRPQRSKEFLAVGWVATLGKYRKVDGTHRLLKGNKLVFYLKSEQLKLDDYVNKRVGISGVIQQQPPSAGAQLILVTGIEVLSD